MPHAIMKALAAIQPGDDDMDSPNGTFDLILSAPTLDRDGETLAADEWKTPLPDHIVMDIDHGMSVATTAGSGKPVIDEQGRLRVKGSYASTGLGQTTRTLVNEGHIRTASVSFMVDKSTKDSKASRELLNGAFVAVPSNRESVVLSSKAFEVIEEDQKAKAGDPEDPKKPYGDVDYADPGFLDADGKPAKDGNGVHRYPLSNASRTRSAWSYINMPKNAGQYTAEQLAKIKDKIKAAAEKFGITIAEDAKSFTPGADNTPEQLLAGLDAVLDEAVDLIAGVDQSVLPENIAQALDLLKAAEGVVDQLMDAVGVFDPDDQKSIGDLVTVKAGARNSSSDTKMIQAIHDASSLLGARCVSEPAPDAGDGSAEGANKAIRQLMVVGKSLVGSVEDLRSRIQCALDDAMGVGGYSGAYAYVQATFLNPDGAGGSIVYSLGGETLCRTFADDGTTVTLDPNIQAVTLVTSVAAIPDTVDGQPDALPDSVDTVKSAGNVTVQMTVDPATDMAAFKAQLDAITGVTEQTITVTPTETSGVAGSPDSPAEQDTPVPPDSKAASKDPADKESADADDDTDKAAEDVAEEKKRLRLLKTRISAANARSAALAS